MRKEAGYLYEFEAFRVDATERRLFCENRPVALPPKAFDTLLLFVERPGHLFEKSELMSALWPDTFVEEGNLAVVISMLRRALRHEGNDHEYIHTEAKHGYRFVADVRQIGEPRPESPSLSTKIEAPPNSRFLSAIPRLLTLAFAGIALVTAAVFLLKPSAAPADIRSVAVLPFRSLKADTAYDYLRMGLADAIITKLAGTGQITVRPTSAVLRYADTAADLATAGREQKVDAILSGYIQSFPDRVRASVQLVRVADGSLLWADSFQESPQKIFDLENEVAERVVQSMPVRLSEATKLRLARRDTESSKAYQFYLEGRYLWNKRTDEGLRRSIGYFQQATAEDPRYALAYTGLADSYVLLDPNWVEPASKAGPLAKAAALSALRLDGSLAEAHASLAMVYFYYDWNWAEADNEFRRAIALNPNYELAHTWYASYLGAMGRYQEALTQVRRAQELDPLSLEIVTEAGRVFYFGRKYRQCIDTFHRIIELDPNNARAHNRLGITYAVTGAFQDATREFEESRRLSRADAHLDGLIGYTQARLRNREVARRLLEQLTAEHDVPAFSIALVYIGLGEPERAIEWLGRAYQNRSSEMVFIMTDPLLDPLRSAPGFGDLLHRMGLQALSF